MFIHDAHQQWKEYTDPASAHIFGYLKDAEHFATIQKGLWILQSITGPWGTYHWKAVKIKPNFADLVMLEAQRMNKELKELQAN
ncbi:hypothetical protein GXN76_08970 [Kroppenstedtia pulmonis]|uniref:Uncharacterized protein n=1 Tax=Kroppenstedtia pulmonis TaxID=1380685 RepID=A0A7D4C6W4_9BACL|nr:hypothetical protein [Kroppenstedtia pulmonis]QKG84596.1 hypothetical protein GXN76_08970 [Kroppenstedtia pulmonis]